MIDCKFSGEHGNSMPLELFDPIEGPLGSGGQGGCKMASVDIVGADGNSAETVGPVVLPPEHDRFQPFVPSVKRPSERQSAKTNHTCGEIGTMTA